MMEVKAPYSGVYSLFFIVHPPTDTSPYWGLELDVSRLLGAFAFIYAVVVASMFGSGIWKPGLPIIVAVLTFLTGILSLVFLGSLPLDKMRIAGVSRVPGELTSSMAKLMPLDRDPGRIAGEDERTARPQ